MKVILTRDVPKLGHDGEIVAVADGYARNYLFPRQLALVAKGTALKQHENRVAREIARTTNLLTVATEAAAKLQDREFQIVAKGNSKSTRLFGSVTEADVAEAIATAIGVTVDKRKISLIDPIKVAGKYALTAKLHPDVVAPFSIDVVTPEILEHREKERQLEADRAAKLAAKAEAAAAAAAPPAAPEESASE